MKNLSLIIIVSIFNLFCITNAYSQNTSDSEAVVFVFDNENVITDNFADKTNNKIIEFTVRGLSSKTEVSELTNKISNYRGVISFTIGEKLENGDYKARVELYNYANYWMYYKFLFLKNGINKIIVGNETILTEDITDK